ncbi:TPA: hypothetical protein ACSCYS_003524 [Aeromonas veronii]
MSGKKPVFSLTGLADAVEGDGASPVHGLDIKKLASGATLSENDKASTAKAEEPKPLHREKLIRKIPAQFFDRIKELKKAGVYRLPANDFFVDAVLEKLEREERKLAAKSE